MGNDWATFGVARRLLASSFQSPFRAWLGWLLLPLSAVLGTYASLLTDWARVLWFGVASTGTATSWLLVSHHQSDLAVRSAIFDAVLATCYFLCFRLAGQPVVGWQWVGAGLVIIGILLLSMG